MTPEEEAQCKEAARERRLLHYAIRFTLDCGGDGEPADGNLKRVLDRCARPAEPREYPAIWEYVARYRAATPQTFAWCDARDHPWSTYNPWADRTWCRCGVRQARGHHEIDMQAIWEIFHDHPYDAPCHCYLPKG